MDDLKNIYVTSPLMPSLEEYVERLKEIWDSKILTNGGKLHDELVEQLKILSKTENVVLTSNGHSALEIAIQSMDLYGEVITTPFTFSSTTHAIVRNGLTPVFCDIKRDDYTIDENKIEDLITEKTTAILPVHVFGNLCNVEAIEKIAKKYSLKVIYDAAHTFGEQYKGISVSNFGDASIVSFHATKVFNTVEGGAIYTQNKELAVIMAQLRNFGIRNAECTDYIGQNAKMSEFHAAMGLCNLKHFEEVRSARKRVANKYIDLLNEVDGIKLPIYEKNISYNYAYFPVVVDEGTYGFSRDDIYDWLSTHRVFARKYFYPITSKFECYNKYNSVSLPIAEEVSDRIICLPIYGDIDDEVIELICHIIKTKQ